MSAHPAPYPRSPCRTTFETPRPGACWRALSPNPGEIFLVIISAGTVVSEIRLTTQPPDTGSISGLTLRGDEIWYVTDAGNVGWIPPPTVGNPPPYAPNNVLDTSRCQRVWAASSCSPSGAS